MPTVDLPTGTVHYRVSGPENAAATIVFVHGVAVDGSLWDGLAARLAAAGVRSYAPDWPLGAHPIPRPAAADQSPTGVARHVHAFLEALSLTDVTLVGNDTGGAICQFVVDADPSRIGRLVLTNCDAYEQFPPSLFRPVFAVLASERATAALMQPMRLTAIRHSPAGFGLLARRLDAGQTRRWIEPACTQPAIRRDLARFCRAVDRAELEAISSRLGRFPGSTLVLWGEADIAFRPALARRLAGSLGGAPIAWVPGARTFVMLDAPDVVAEAILAHLHGGGEPGHGPRPAA